MIPRELVPFVESGLSTLVGTTSPALRPECMRGVGVCVRDGGRSARVYLPSRSAERTIENLNATKRVAVTISKPQTHRTVQLKGPVVAVAPADASEQERVESLFKNFIDDLAFIGLPRGIVSRMAHWPCWAVDFDVAAVFVQTPGPRAGQLLAEGDL